MPDLGEANGTGNGPALFVSDSFMLAAQAGCDAADRLRGGVEVAWSAYGQWTIAKGARFGAIYLSHPFLLKAECGLARFRVKPMDLSALGRRVSASYPHLTVLGQMHRHPGRCKPTPSPTDDEDRERMANLLRDCAEREVVECWEVPPHLPRVGNNGDARQRVEYAIDPRLVISMGPRSGSPPSSALPAPARGIAQAPTVTCTRRVGLAYQVFLICNAQAEREAIHAQVMEFRRLPFGEDVATLFDDWKVEILPDTEVAARLAMDVDLVRCDVDRDRIAASVEECVHPFGGGTTCTCPNSYWSSDGGAGGVIKCRDPNATGAADGICDGVRPNG
jgi:hypothetical protein